MLYPLFEGIKAATEYNAEIDKRKKKKLRKPTKYQVQCYIKVLPKTIIRYIDYRIKRLRYSDSDITLARIFNIPISQAWALGRDGGNMYRQMKKGRL